MEKRYIFPLLELLDNVLQEGNIEKIIYIDFWGEVRGIDEIEKYNYSDYKSFYQSLKNKYKIKKIIFVHAIVEWGGDIYYLNKTQYNKNKDIKNIIDKYAGKIKTDKEYIYFENG